MIRYQLNDYADKAWSNEYVTLQVEARTNTKTLLVGRTEKQIIYILIPNAIIRDDFDFDNGNLGIFSVHNCLYCLTWC